MMFGENNPTRRGGTPELTAPESLDSEDWRFRHRKTAGLPVTTRDLTIKRADGTTVAPPPEVLEQVRTMHSGRNRTAVPPPPPPIEETFVAEGDGNNWEADPNMDWDDEPDAITQEMRDDPLDDAFGEDDDDDLDDLDGLLRRRPAPKRSSRPASNPQAPTVSVPTMASLQAYEARVQKRLEAHEKRVAEMIAASERRVMTRVKRAIVQMMAEDG
jgi:hypothetical protein